MNKDDSENRARLQNWASSERSSRSVIGRGNASSASAVTGHRKKNPPATKNSKAGGGYSSGASSGKVSKSVSALSVISSSKRNKFGA